VSIAKFIFGVCVLLLLGLAGIHWTGGARKTEQSLYNSAERALIAQELTWARTSMDGQKVTLSGFAPSQEVFDQTIAALNRSSGFGGPVFGGVTTIDASRAEVYQGFKAVAEEEPEDARMTPEVFAWRVAYDGEQVVLSGHVPSNEAKDLILKAVERQFRSTAINDSSQPAKGVEEGGWLVAATASLTALSALESGNIEAVRNDFAVNGIAVDEITAKAARQMSVNLPMPFTSKADITFKKPVIAVEAETPQIDGDAIVNDDISLNAEQCQSRINRIMIGRQILFASSQSVIEPDSRTILDNLAATLLNCSGVVVAIEGHTDSTGYPDVNQRISILRAGAVKAYLMRKGIQEETLLTEGFGAYRPIASNQTVAGRARNRRIEFAVSEQEEN